MSEVSIKLHVTVDVDTFYSWPESKQDSLAAFTLKHFDIDLLAIGATKIGYEFEVFPDKITIGIFGVEMLIS